MRAGASQVSYSPQGEVLRTTIRQLLTSHGHGTATVLSLLLAVQEALGYLPSEAITEVADFAGVTVNDVWAVASFYTNFRFTPPGEHVVEVCWGPSCHLAGAPALLRAVLTSLGLTTEGETPDRGITFKYNTCLGACAQAPVMSLDHRLVGRATPAIAEKRLQSLRQTRAKAVHPRASSILAMGEAP